MSEPTASLSRALLADRCVAAKRRRDGLARDLERADADLASHVRALHRRGVSWQALAILLRTPASTLRRHVDRLDATSAAPAARR